MLTSQSSPDGRKGVQFFGFLSYLSLLFFLVNRLQMSSQVPPLDAMALSSASRGGGGGQTATRRRALLRFTVTEATAAAYGMLFPFLGAAFQALAIPLWKVFQSVRDPTKERSLSSTIRGDVSVGSQRASVSQENMSFASVRGGAANAAAQAPPRLTRSQVTSIVTVLFNLQRAGGARLESASANSSPRPPSSSLPGGTSALPPFVDVKDDWLLHLLDDSVSPVIAFLRRDGVLCDAGTVAPLWDVASAEGAPATVSPMIVSGPSPTHSAAPTSPLLGKVSCGQVSGVLWRLMDVVIGAVVSDGRMASTIAASTSSSSAGGGGIDLRAKLTLDYVWIVFPKPTRRRAAAGSVRTMLSEVHGLPSKCKPPVLTIGIDRRRAPHPAASASPQSPPCQSEDAPGCQEQQLNTRAVNVNLVLRLPNSGGGGDVEPGGVVAYRATAFVCLVPIKLARRQIDGLAGGGSSSSSAGDVGREWRLLTYVIAGDGLLLVQRPSESDDDDAAAMYTPLASCVRPLPDEGLCIGAKGSRSQNNSNVGRLISRFCIAVVYAIDLEPSRRFGQGAVALPPAPEVDKASQNTSISSGDPAAAAPSTQGNAPLLLMDRPHRVDDRDPSHSTLQSWSTSLVPTVGGGTAEQDEEEHHDAPRPLLIGAPQDSQLLPWEAADSVLRLYGSDNHSVDNDDDESDSAEDYDEMPQRASSTFAFLEATRRPPQLAAAVPPYYQYNRDVQSVPSTSAVHASLSLCQVAMMPEQTAAVKRANLTEALSHWPLNFVAWFLSTCEWPAASDRFRLDFGNGPEVFDGAQCLYEYFKCVLLPCDVTEMEREVHRLHDLCFTAMTIGDFVSLLNRVKAIDPADHAFFSEEGDATELMWRLVERFANMNPAMSVAARRLLLNNLDLKSPLAVMQLSRARLWLPLTAEQVALPLDIGVIWRAWEASRVGEETRDDLVNNNASMTMVSGPSAAEIAAVHASLPVGTLAHRPVELRSRSADQPSCGYVRDVGSLLHWMIVSRVDHLVLSMYLDSTVIAQQSSQGFSAIHYAAMFCERRVLDKLLEATNPAEARIIGRGSTTRARVTPLHLALLYQKWENALSLSDPFGKCREKPTEVLVVTNMGVIIDAHGAGAVVGDREGGGAQLTVDSYDLVLASWQWSNRRRQQPIELHACLDLIDRAEAELSTASSLSEEKLRSGVTLNDAFALIPFTRFRQLLADAATHIREAAAIVALIAGRLSQQMEEDRRRAEAALQEAQARIDEASVQVTQFQQDHVLEPSPPSSTPPRPPASFDRRAEVAGPPAVIGGVDASASRREPFSLSASFHVPTSPPQRPSRSSAHFSSDLKALRRGAREYFIECRKHLQTARHCIAQIPAANAAADVAADVWRDVAVSMEVGPHKDALLERFLGVVPWYRLLPSFAFMLLFLSLMLADIMIYPYDVAVAPLNYTEQLILPCLEAYRCVPNVLVDDVVATLSPFSLNATINSSASINMGKSFRCSVRLVRLAFWNRSTSAVWAQPPILGDLTTLAAALAIPLSSTSASSSVVMQTVTSAGFVDMSPETPFSSASEVGSPFSFEPTLMQFVSDVEFRRYRPSKQSPVRLTIGSQVNLVWKYTSAQDCPRQVSWPPTFAHSVAIKGDWGFMTPWTAMTYALAAITLAIFVVSLNVRHRFEFEHFLKLPTDAEVTRDTAFSVFQGLILLSVFAVTTYARLITTYGPEDAWGPFTHLRRMRIFLRLGKVLCAFPGLYFVRHLPTRRLFQAVNVVLGLSLLFYFMVMSYSASFLSSDSTADLRSANSALPVSVSSIFELVGRQVSDSAIVEPVAFLVSLGVVAAVSKSLDVYTRQCYWNQWHTRKEHFAREQTETHAAVAFADRASSFDRRFYRFPVHQRQLLDGFAALLLLFIYFIIVLVIAYPIHLGARDAQEAVSLTNVLV